MAESNQEISVINHLLKVEKEAYGLIDDAMKEAENRLSSARVYANNEYKSQYESCIHLIEEKYQSELNQINSNHEAVVNQYKLDLTGRSQNKKAFNELLDKLLFLTN